MPEPRDRLPVRSRLEKAISEVQGLHELLHSGELDPQILADFRDALNRVRNTAWAAQQYANRKASDQDSTGVLSFLARERIRATYHLCRAVNEDLKRTDVQFQRGSLIELDEITKALTQQLRQRHQQTRMTDLLDRCGTLAVSSRLCLIRGEIKQSTKMSRSP
jgi:hypothetical protein